MDILDYAAQNFFGVKIGSNPFAIDYSPPSSSCPECALPLTGFVTSPGDDGQRQIWRQDVWCTNCGYRYCDS